MKQPRYVGGTAFITLPSIELEVIELDPPRCLCSGRDSVPRNACRR